MENVIKETHTQAHVKITKHTQTQTHIQIIKFQSTNDRFCKLNSCTIKFVRNKITKIRLRLIFYLINVKKRVFSAGICLA